MRPWITLTIIVVGLSVAAYFHFRAVPLHPRETDFVNCYVELSLLSARSDTAAATFLQERDSILRVFNFTDSTLWRVKADLNRDPQRIIEIWDRIETRLRARRVELGLGPEIIKE